MVRSIKFKIPQVVILEEWRKNSKNDMKISDHMEGCVIYNPECLCDF